MKILFTCVYTVLTTKYCTYSMELVTIGNASLQLLSK